MIVWGLLGLANYAIFKITGNCLFGRDAYLNPLWKDFAVGGIFAIERHEPDPRALGQFCHRLLYVCVRRSGCLRGGSNMIYTYLLVDMI